MKKITFVTGNEHKLSEAREILHDFEILAQDLDLHEIQTEDFTELVTHKAEQAFAKVKKPLIVEDTGVIFEAWGKFPGAYIKHLLYNLKREGILKVMENEENRKIWAFCTIGYHDGEKVHVFEGELPGYLAREVLGESGFGFDPLFIPEGETRSLGEMTQSEKCKFSHRKRAFEKLREHLKKD